MCKYTVLYLTYTTTNILYLLPRGYKFVLFAWFCFICVSLAKGSGVNIPSLLSVKTQCLFYPSKHGIHINSITVI